MGLPSGHQLGAVVYTHYHTPEGPLFEVETLYVQNTTDLPPSLSLSPSLSLRSYTRLSRTRNYCIYTSVP